MTTLTFLVVLLILAPIAGFPYMYSNAKLITHLVIPLLGLISYIFLEETTLFEWKYSLLGFLPFFIYSLVYIPNVVFFHNWPDLYRVNAHGFWYLILIGFYLGNFIVIQGLYFLKKIINRRLYNLDH